MGLHSLGTPAPPEIHTNKLAVLHTSCIAKMTSSHSVTKHVDVAIVGGGLSALMAAHKILQSRPSSNIQIFEEQERMGGRLQVTTNGVETESERTWPSDDHRVLSLVKELGLDVMDQPGFPKSLSQTGAHRLLKELYDHTKGSELNVLTNHMVKKVLFKDD